LPIGWGQLVFLPAVWARQIARVSLGRSTQCTATTWVSKHRTIIIHFVPHCHLLLSNKKEAQFRASFATSLVTYIFVYLVLFVNLYYEEIL
jgi:hypothetical protein